MSVALGVAWAATRVGRAAIDITSGNPHAKAMITARTSRKKISAIWDGADR
jgi:hypothetical protein